MEKALHDYFYINTGKELKLYSDNDYMFLVEAANFHLDRCNGKEPLNTLPELDTFIYECIDEFHRIGVTDGLLHKLNGVLQGIRVQCLIENVNNKLSAVHIAFIPSGSPPKLLAAYMFFHITSLGGLEGLKRCQNNNCMKFFIGRSNSKWCSKSCGSKHRVKKMRKNKRALY